MEVGLDRLLGGDVVILLQHLAAHADGGLEQRRRGGLPPEKGDDALRDGALALPVAPAGGLEDGSAILATLSLYSEETGLSLEADCGKAFFV